MNTVAKTQRNRMTPGVDPPAPEVVVRPARSREELEQAFRLVYSTYRDEGYVGEDEAGMRVTIYNAFPDTVTLVGMADEKVVATVTLIGDTDIGLPMDELYREEIDELRDAGRKVAEVGMQANKHIDIAGQRPMFLRLMKQVFDYAWFILQADDVCITVHPKHAKFYRKMLLFESLGEEKPYNSVQGNPAVAQRLNMRTARERYGKRERLRKLFFESRTPVPRLARRRRMTAEDLRYFFVEQTSVFQDASSRQIEALRHLYPECPWTQWERSWKGGLPALAQLISDIPRAMGSVFSHLRRMGREDIAALTGDSLAASGE